MQLEIDLFPVSLPFPFPFPFPNATPSGADLIESLSNNETSRGSFVYRILFSLAECRC